jgi:hypothetical protein
MPRRGFQRRHATEGMAQDEDLARPRTDDRGDSVNDEKRRAAALARCGYNRSVSMSADSAAGCWRRLG